LSIIAINVKENTKLKNNKSMCWRRGHGMMSQYITTHEK